jgi:hypothetical protein
MKITNHPIHGFNLRAPQANLGAGPRTSGVHLSGILRKMAVKYGKLPAEYANNDIGALIRETPIDMAGGISPLCRLAFGMAWEDWIKRFVELFWVGFVHQPGEFERDGILGTPDGLSSEPDGSIAVHEFKFTWKSMAKKSVAEEWLWLAQVAGYAALVSHLLGGVPITKAYLHVAYANGDYKRDADSGPKYAVYAIEMTQEEVEMAWVEYVNHKELAQPEAWEE